MAKISDARDKAQRTHEAAVSEINAQAADRVKKTARLKALRVAKEAQDEIERLAAPVKKKATPRAKAAK